MKSFELDGDAWRGEALAEALRATGLSRRKIATLTGVTPACVALWMNGKVVRRPHQRQREKIAALLERGA